MYDACNPWMDYLMVLKEHLRLLVYEEWYKAIGYQICMELS
jgi:hypothetical protein